MIVLINSTALCEECPSSMHSCFFKNFSTLERYSLLSKLAIFSISCLFVVANGNGAFSSG